MKAITFDDDTLKAFHGLTNRYVYAIQGLQIDEYNHPDTNNDPTVPSVDLPCDRRKRSRWLKLIKDNNGDWIKKDKTTISTSDCTNDLSPSSSSALEGAIHGSIDQNPYMKDVYFRGNCEDSDSSKHSFLVYVAVEDQCYENVHPDYM